MQDFDRVVVNVMNRLEVPVAAFTGKGLLFMDPG